MQDYAHRLACVIKKNRLEMDYTQEQLAEKAHIDVRTVIAIEKERGNPKLETLFPIIRALKMDARELFDDVPQCESRAARTLRLTIEQCSDDDAATLLPIVEAVLNALHSSKGIPIE